MKVKYFFRHPRPEYHSIERLFHGLANYLNKQTGGPGVTEVTCPRSAVTPLNLLRNCLYARRHRGAINHITGDVHYLALALPKRTTILTIHDCVLLTRYPAWHPMHWFHYLLWYKWPISRAAIVTTISEKSKAELVQAVGVPPEKVRIVPNFVDPGFVPDPLPAPAQLAAQPVILQVGTAPNKNLDRLIVALAGLPCQLVIIGQPTPAQTNLLLRHQITYQVMTNVDADTLRRAYAGSDIVAFVSLYEGFGLPILEAQAMNKALITSNIDPMKTVAGVGAALVNSTDVPAIRAGIDRLLTDTAYHDLVRANGRINVGQYSIDRVAAQYVALYESL